MKPPDFSFGSTVWPGLAKLVEEMGELQQVLGKLVMTGGDTEHWSGDLRAKLVDEIADVAAAIAFFDNMNFTPEEQKRIYSRTLEKLATFKGWHGTPETP